jgi:hypothetical protein
MEKSGLAGRKARTDVRTVRMARMKVKDPINRNVFDVEIELVFMISTPCNLLNVW